MYFCYRDGIDGFLNYVCWPENTVNIFSRVHIRLFTRSRRHLLGNVLKGKIQSTAKCCRRLEGMIHLENSLNSMIAQKTILKVINIRRLLRISKKTFVLSNIFVNGMLKLEDKLLCVQDKIYEMNHFCTSFKLSVWYIFQKQLSFTHASGFFTILDNKE